MNSKVVGELSPTHYDPDFFESKPYSFPYFDNKEIKVGFVEAVHQPYLDGADKTLENFIRLTCNDKIQNSDIVHDYYCLALKHGYTKRLDIKNTKDIWRFVTPTEIIVDWDENGRFYLCVSCECEWEVEHGLQLVFTDGQTLTRASGHDGYLTD